MEIRRLLTLAASAALCLFLITATSAGADRPDAWLTTKAKLALLTAEGVDGLDISVDTTEARVTLSGRVDSNGEKAKAERIVRGVEGVRDVRNLLTVETHKSSMERATVDDEQLEEQVEDALDDDWGLDGVDIEVASVEHGVVVLRGDAETLPAKHRAVALVRNFPGVVRVIDQIDEPDDAQDSWNMSDMNSDVLDDGRSVFDDAWITTRVKLELMARDDVPALDINVDTYDRKVTLFGIVPDEASMRAAEKAAREVDAVESVSNKIQIVADSRREIVEERDEVVSERVEEAIDNAVALDGADIDVEVKDGVVRLTGALDREAQRLTAVSVARGVVGVRAVSNELRIDGETDE